MRLYEIQKLLEYKRDITARRMGQKILAGLQKDNIFSNKIKELSQEEQIYKVLEKLEDMDPTKNKQFVQWLSKQYGLFRIEDGERVKDALGNFVKLKTQIKRQDKSVDINSYSWYEFEKMIDEITQVDIGSDVEDTTKDVKVLYNGTYGKLLIPETKEASCKIGSGTKWCTSAKNNNMFDQYSVDGPLYIWIDKSGDKYQFHFENSQYMDARDIEISNDKMKYFINKHPVLSKFFSKFIEKDITNLIKYIENPDKDIIMAAVKQNEYAIRQIEKPDKDIIMAAVNQNGYAIKYIDSPDKNMKIASVKKHGNAIQHIKNPDKDIQLAAVKQAVGAIYHIDKPDKEIQMAAVTQNVDAIFHIKNPHPDVKKYVKENR